MVDLHSKNLIRIKLVHTLIWILFNLVMIYLYYAIITNRIGIYVWLGLGSFVLEGVILLLYGMKCPLTLVARKYSDSTKDNFDIYLHEWLAKYNKLIYTGLLVVLIILLIYQKVYH